MINSVKGGALDLQEKSKGCYQFNMQAICRQTQGFCIDPDAPGGPSQPQHLHRERLKEKSPEKYD